jgi:protein SDA1
MQQWNHYESMRRLFELNPDEEGARFREVITFISQVPSSPFPRPRGPRARTHC